MKGATTECGRMPPMEARQSVWSHPLWMRVFRGDDRAKDTRTYQGRDFVMPSLVTFRACAYSGGEARCPQAIARVE